LGSLHRHAALVLDAAADFAGGFTGSDALGLDVAAAVLNGSGSPVAAHEIALAVHRRTAAAHRAAAMGTAHGRATSTDRTLLINDSPAGMELSSGVNGAQDDSVQTQGNDGGDGYGFHDGFLNCAGKFDFKSRIASISKF